MKIECNNGNVSVTVGAVSYDVEVLIKTNIKQGYDIAFLMEEKKKLEVECKNSEDKVEQITIINARLCQQYDYIKNMEVFKEVDKLNAELKKLNSMNSIKQHIALEERNAELEGRIRQFESYVQSAIDDLQTLLS